MKLHKTILVMAAVGLALVACSSRLTNDNLSKVQSGMGESEVKSILGNPSRVETGETLGIRGTTYYYKAGDSEVQVVFVNDAVISKSGSFVK